MTDIDETPDGWDEEAVQMMVERAEDEQPETVDADAKTRQDEGWMKLYVECPDCTVPMSRVTLEGDSIETPDFIRDADESRYRFICPECSEMASHIRVQRVTAGTDDIKEAYEHIVDIAESLLRAFKSGSD